MESNPQNKCIYVFDLDDTLIKSNAHITVTDKHTNEKVQYTTDEYNAISKELMNNDNLSISFEEFNKYEALQNAALLPMYYVFLALYKAGLDMCIVTSRQYSQPIKQWLKSHNIALPENKLYAINENLSTDNPMYGHDGILKKETLRLLYKNEGYNTFVVYDDCNEFNQCMKSLEFEEPVNVIIQSHFYQTPLN